MYLSSALGSTPTAAQSAERTIAIDHSRPFIDIVFERFGRRAPVFSGETERGVWLRLRNNCIVPIKVNVLRRKNENEGALVVHEVVEETRILNEPVISRKDPFRSHLATRARTSLHLQR